jgi:hypothetical protein
MDRRKFMGMAGLGLAGVPLSGRLGAADRVITSRIRMVGTRVVMPVTIGGQGPFEFLIDTGGYLSLIDGALARRLKLPFARTVQSRGVGGRAQMPVFLAREVVFGGGVRQATVAFAGRDGDFGRGIAGTLAAGMLTAVDSDLDFEAGEWRAYPDGRPAREGFVRMGGALVATGRGAGAGSRRLFGEASVNGRTGRFLLDTGAPRGLVLEHDAARSMGLWDDARPWAPVRPRGIGGEAGISRWVRAETVSFAGVTFRRPLVMLNAASDGRSAREIGVVGLEVLKRFTLSTDARRGELWARAHPTPGELDERYGLSGLWLDRKGDGWVAAAVGAGSPAAAAGIAVGDTVAAQDGGSVLAEINGAPGSTAALTVTRGGTGRAVSLTLAPYL